jgi:hypothetical protein
MAGFNTLGSTVQTNVGGSFNPAFGGTRQIGASGQSYPPGYGVQPPRLSNPFNVNALGLSGSRSTQQAPFNAGTAQTYYPGADTSAQHQANVQMAQAGFGNIGLQEYAGFPGQVPGISSANYGIAPGGWADINAYLANPLGQWQIPQGSTLTQEGQTPPPSNASRYQMIIDTIKSSLSGQWPDMSSMLKQFPNTTNYITSSPQPAWAGISQFGPNSDQTYAALADLPFRFGGPAGALLPPAAQNLGTPTTGIPGVSGVGA